jgi:hypothetical protein
MKGLGTGKRIIQLFNNPDLDLNMRIMMAGVEYFRPGFGAENRLLSLRAEGAAVHFLLMTRA